MWGRRGGAGEETLATAKSAVANNLVPPCSKAIAKNLAPSIGPIYVPKIGL